MVIVGRVSGYELRAANVGLVRIRRSSSLDGFPRLLKIEFVGRHSNTTSRIWGGFL